MIDFKNKKVCVFGGTGSIGSLIVERLLLETPDSIRIMCNNEQELYESQQKWRKYSILRYLLGDIRDKERVLRALKNVDYVFNCAAVKHIDIAELNPIEAVNVNIRGLENIIDACVIQGIERLLHISTDKAVESPSVMGATKFIGERLCQIRAEQNNELDIVCIRSGNVWNSRGSFTSKLKEYGENTIPITNTKMKRFFIKQDELQSFIFKAFKYGRSGEIWIPKLQEINIMDLIGDREYRVIGIRKGEKIKENLYSDEEAFRLKEYEDYWVIT